MEKNDIISGIRWQIVPDRTLGGVLMQNMGIVYSRRAEFPLVPVHTFLVIVIGYLTIIALAMTIKNGTEQRIYSEHTPSAHATKARIEREVIPYEYKPVIEEETEFVLTKTAAESVDEIINKDIKHFSEETYVAGAIMVHYEAGGVDSVTERSGCLWVACNRVISESSFYPDDLIAVIEQEGQFTGYFRGGTYTEEDYLLAVDVFERFYREQNGESPADVGRTLPEEYVHFYGDGEHNYFTIGIGGAPYVWDEDFITPYEN